MSRFLCKRVGFFYKGKTIERKCDKRSAPQSKNAVSAFQITCKLLSFTLEDS